MQEAPISREEGARGELGRILIVEDERVVARDLAAALSNFGYSVVATAASGEDAVEKARELRPDLVLMDVHLSGDMDGIHAAELIKKNQNVPVIYLTAHSDDETLHRAKKTGPHAYLVKPFKAAELRCAIEIALHKGEIEARLRRREGWLAKTLRSIRAAVAIADSEEKVTFLNPVAEALTGWTHEVALEKTLDQILRLVAAESDATVEAPALALQTGGTPWLAQKPHLVPRSGAPIPMRKRAGDVTAERRAADEIRKLNEDLERRVVERTELLEAANRELDAFNVSVAHDLRAPLRGIDGFSQALIEQHAANLSGEGLDKLHRIRLAVQRMSRLIDDLLRLSRVARSELAKLPVDFSRLARTVAAELQAKHPEREVECIIADGMTLNGDESLLRIVLENLLENARKFTSKVDHPRIECGQIKQDDVAICFVRDNGAGFDMERAQNLFGAFHRLHSESEFEGTGIGLAIVQRIIDRHGGLIWAESAVGRGTTFHFTV